MDRLRYKNKKKQKQKKCFYERETTHSGFFFFGRKVYIYITILQGLGYNFPEHIVLIPSISLSLALRNL